MKFIWIGLLLLWPIVAMAQENLPDEGLILHLQLNGNTNDISGNNNNAQPIGSLIPVTDRFGEEAGAYSFDDNSTYITVESSPTIASPVNAISFALWVKITDWRNNYAVFLAKPGQNAVSQYDFLANKDRNIIGPYRNNCSLSNEKTSLELDQWYFLSQSWDGDTVEYYIDGEKVGETINCSTTLIENTQSLEIGRYTPGVPEFFYGVMDDIQIYNRALNQEEIEAQYDEGQTVPAAPLNLTASSVSNQEIILSWEDLSFNKSHFILERINTVNQIINEIEIPRNTTSYRDTALTSNSTYQYRLKAVSHSNQESAFSTAASERTLDDIALESGLIAYYSMNGDAVDMISDNDGTVGGMETTPDRFGTDEQALWVNDKSDYIHIEPILDSVITASMWYYYQSPLISAANRREYTPILGGFRRDFDL